MGVPIRFAIEYPRRVLELMDVLEAEARQRHLLGSFGLLAAAAVLTIPYERMRTAHFLHDQVRDADLASGVKRLEKVKFLSAPFWRDEAPGEWYQSHVMASVDDVDAWRDETGRPCLNADANTIRRRNAAEVIRVLRNALAHGNIIYLNNDFREIPGHEMVYMAFLSRYEETEEQRKQAETYRVVVTSEEEFLRFVKAWAVWVSRFRLDRSVREAA